MPEPRTSSRGPHEYKDLSNKLFELINYDRKLNKKPLLEFNEKVYQDALKNS